MKGESRHLLRERRIVRMAIHRMQQENAVAAFSPSEEEDFGAFIERIRRRSRIQIQEVVAQFPEYLNA